MVVTGDTSDRSHEVDAKMGDAFTASGKGEEKEEGGSQRFARVVPENLICLSFKHLTIFLKFITNLHAMDWKLMNITPP